MRGTEDIHKKPAVVCNLSQKKLWKLQSRPPVKQLLIESVLLISVCIQYIHACDADEQGAKINYGTI